MIFLRPKILRDGAQAAYETDLKYNYMLDEQKKMEKMGSHEAVPLLPGVSRGALPALPPGGSASGVKPPATPPSGQAAPANAPAPAAAAPAVPPAGAPATPGTAAPDTPAATPADQPPKP
jgi:hypothetical protein